MLLRLARYNSIHSDPARAWVLKDFFLGVPAPVGGLLVLAPLAFSLQLGAGWWDDPLAVTIWTLAIAVLLVAPIPTWSAKNIRISSNAIVAVLAGLATVIALDHLGAGRPDGPGGHAVSRPPSVRGASVPVAPASSRRAAPRPALDRRTPAVVPRDPGGVTIADELEA